MVKRARELGPARKQATEEEVFDEKPQSAFYNIWYDKVEDFSKWRERRDAKLAGKRYRLDPKKDVGMTKAPSTAYICLYFARGKCVHGGNCKFLHRLPNEYDEQRIGQMHDVFGRDRHKTDREDMGGVGSFNRDNKTLYIQGIRTTAPDAEERIREEFGVFGEILKRRSLMFITYKLRVSAEFAKEALADQSIIGNEAINVRWAHEDPNPKAAEELEREQTLKALESLYATDPEYFSQYESLHAQGVYPTTDHQYGGGGQAAQGQYLPDGQGGYKWVPTAPSAADKAAGASSGGSNWVQVGDEVSGYYWVYAGAAEDAGDQVATEQLNKPLDMGGESGEKKEEDGKKTEEGGEQKEKAAEAPPPESAEVKSHRAWQSFYASQGYPYYYDAAGQVVYYDPNLHNQQTAPAANAAADPTADSYQYYSSVPVPRTNAEYFALFEGYDTANSS